MVANEWDSQANIAVLGRRGVIFGAIVTSYLSDFNLLQFEPPATDREARSIGDPTCGPNAPEGTPMTTMMLVNRRTGTTEPFTLKLVPPSQVTLGDVVRDRAQLRTINEAKATTRRGKTFYILRFEGCSGLPDDLWVPSDVELYVWRSEPITNDNVGK